jgi:hypothetical protein
MKLKAGDSIDSAHCTALKHEFLRCEDAFKEFHQCALAMIAAEPVDRRLAYSAYNAYSRFIHHLYEFLIGAIARERGDTETIRADVAELYVTSNMQRVLARARNAAQMEPAKTWASDLSAYPEQVPPSFAREFRRHRNTVSAHVSHERSRLSLSDFYRDYHLYLYLLYRDCQSWWGLGLGEFPDLKEITDFSVLIKGVAPDEP